MARPRADTIYFHPRWYFKKEARGCLVLHQALRADKIHQHHSLKTSLNSFVGVP